MNDATKRDTDRAASRTQRGGGESRNAATQRDTERAQSRTDRGRGTTGKTADRNPTMSEREAANGLTNTMAGREAVVNMDDPFYSPGAAPEPPQALPGTDIYSADGGGLPSAGSSGGIDGLICINGVLFNATIQGSIGDELE